MLWACLSASPPEQRWGQALARGLAPAGHFQQHSSPEAWNPLCILPAAGFGCGRSALECLGAPLGSAGLVVHPGRFRASSGGQRCSCVYFAKCFVLISDTHLYIYKRDIYIIYICMYKIYIFIYIKERILN